MRIHCLPIVGPVCWALGSANRLWKLGSADDAVQADVCHPRHSGLSTDSLRLLPHLVPRLGLVRAVFLPSSSPTYNISQGLNLGQLSFRCVVHQFLLVQPGNVLQTGNNKFLFLGRGESLQPILRVYPVPYYPAQYFRLFSSCTLYRP